MKKKKITLLICGIIITSALCTGCSLNENSSQVSGTIIPEKIISNVINNEENPRSYYGEFKIQVYENDKMISESFSKEWVQPDNKRRTEINGDKDGETIITCDGKNIALYCKDTNQAIVGSVLSGIGQKDPKKQILDELSFMNKSHYIENKGEEKLSGRKVYHLYGKPKENSLIGDVEYWIDKDDWFIVKSIVNSGESKFITEYTKIQFNPKIKEDIFTQKIPDNAEITNADEAENVQNITLDQLKTKLNCDKPLTYKGNDYNMDRIEYLDNGEELGDECNQIYVDDRNLEIFTISMKKYKKADNLEGLKVPGEKDIVIRGKEGSSIENNNFKCINWVEDDISYNIFTVSPNMSLEKCKEIVEKME